MLGTALAEEARTHPDTLTPCWVVADRKSVKSYASEHETLLAVLTPKEEDCGVVGPRGTSMAGSHWDLGHQVEHLGTVRNQSSTPTSRGCKKQQHQWAEQSPGRRSLPQMPASLQAEYMPLTCGTPRKAVHGGFNVSLTKMWKMCQCSTGHANVPWTCFAPWDRGLETITMGPGWFRAIFLVGATLCCLSLLTPRVGVRPNPELLRDLFKPDSFQVMPNWIESGFLDVCYTRCQIYFPSKERFSSNSSWAWQASRDWN